MVNKFSNSEGTWVSHIGQIDGVEAAVLPGTLQWVPFLSLFPDNNPKISRGEPTQGLCSPAPCGSGVAWLARRQAWRPHLPAQRLPSPAPPACARKLAFLIFRALRSVSLFPRWSCWCTTGAAGSRSGTSWSTRLWPDGQQRRLCSGWSSLARGPLSTETGFYLKE